MTVRRWEMYSVARMPGTRAARRVAVGLALALMAFGCAGPDAATTKAVPQPGTGTDIQMAASASDAVAEPKLYVRSMGFGGTADALRIRFDAQGPVRHRFAPTPDATHVSLMLDGAVFDGISPLTIVGDGNVESVQTAATADGNGEIRVTAMREVKPSLELRDGGFDLVLTPTGAERIRAATVAVPTVKAVEVSEGRVVFALPREPSRIDSHLLSDGMRLVLDMHGVDWSGEPVVAEYPNGPVARVIVRPTAESVRAVIEARVKGALADYRIETDTTGFAVALAAAAKTPVVAQASVAPAPVTILAAKPEEATGGGTVVDFGFHQDATRSFVDLSFSKPAGYDVTEASGTRVVVDIRNTKLPEKYQRALDTSAFAGAVRLAAAYTRGKDVRLVVDLKTPAPFTVEPRGDGFSLAFEGGSESVAAGPEEPEVKDKIVLVQPDGAVVPQGVAPAAAAPQPGMAVAIQGTTGQAVLPGSKETGYVGRPINMDFVDADVKNILRILAEHGGFNLVTGSEVSGKTTVKLVNVPWDQALSVILKSKGYDKDIDGNVMRVVAAERLAQERAAKVAEEQAALKAKEELTPLANDIFVVNYASASEILDKVQSVLSGRGSATVDTRTNSILIRDLPEKIEEARELVARLDTATPQVLIEARIVEVSSTYSDELGIQWGGGFTADAAHGNATDFAFPNTIGISGATGLQNYAINLPAAAATGGGAGGALALSLGHINDILSLDLRLSAIETAGKGRVVSSPRVTTLDNKTAEISQGIEIPFTTATEEKIETESIDYLLQLKVTPHVTSDDSISLNIELTKDAPSTTFFATDSFTPAVETRKAMTEVLVKNGETTVIGGIITDTVSQSEQAIPWFRHIPLIGWMFETESNRADKTELIIFITPKIVRIDQQAGLY